MRWNAPPTGTRSSPPSTSEERRPIRALRPPCGPNGSIVWDRGPNALQNEPGRAVDTYMKNGEYTQDSVLRLTEWITIADTPAPILRKAATGALLQDSRLELHFDDASGDYLLGVAAGC